MMVISPMVDAYAVEVAKNLGIEIFGLDPIFGRALWRPARRF